MDGIKKIEKPLGEGFALLHFFSVIKPEEHHACHKGPCRHSRSIQKTFRKCSKIRLPGVIQKNKHSGSDSKSKSRLSSVFPAFPKRKVRMGAVTAQSENRDKNSKTAMHILRSGKS